MEKSEKIGSLAAALANAQAQMLPALKDAENPHFRSTYATLAAVWDAIRKPLSDNKLAVMQTTEPSDVGIICVTTLVHSSGEYVTSKLFIPASKKDAHGYGSALTYARRFALSAMVGVAQVEDDDGNAAAIAQAPKQVTQPKKPDNAREKVVAASKRYGWSGTQVAAYAVALHGKQLAELNELELSQLSDGINRHQADSKKAIDEAAQSKKGDKAL
jgi:hypothetical protein